MFKYKIKILLLISIAFISANFILYTISNINKEQRIQMELKDNIKNLQIHYEILLYNQKTIAKTVYKSTINTNGFIDIISKANQSTDEEKIKLREKLYHLLKDKYSILKENGVLQYQFLLPNNISFLRMHKPSKFGDDLSDVRADFKYTNKMKKATRGFSQGRVSHGFRNIFPIFDKNNKYLGAMEVSFSSESFQKHLTKISKIHTHFLVNKSIFTAKSWERDDSILKYIQSSEHKDYLLNITINHTHEICIIENKQKLSSSREDINKNIKKGDKFALYTVHSGNHVDVISFYPIKDFNNKKTVAWLVSYEESDFIYATIKAGWIIKITSFFLFFLLGYYMYKQVVSKQIIKQEHRLLNDVLNSTEDLMFVTDFITVSFLNRKFRNFMNINSSDEFNKKTNNNLLSIFEQNNGYLNTQLLEENETFASHILKTNEEERVVSILDKDNNRKAFTINITKTNYHENDDYLVTLSDITKLKEKEIKIENKAYYDGLTAVYNRNKFDEIIEEEMHRIKRYKHPLSIAIIDIDHFKNFNDTYGHLIGDEVLIMLAQTLNNKIRDTDTFARWGGEEFVILFTETTIENTKIIAENLRKSIEDLEHKVAGKITVSFGITQYIEDDSLETMFKRCDEALYLAKDQGRNRVCIK